MDIKRSELIRMLTISDNLENIIFNWIDAKFHLTTENVDDYCDRLIVRYDSENIQIRLKNGELLDIPMDELFTEDDRPDLKMLWHVDYYDGPLSGIAEYQGERVWFAIVQLHDEEPLVPECMFGLYRLTSEELNFEEVSHQRFRDLVGSHTDYGEEYQPFTSNTKKNDEFYNTELEKREPVHLHKEPFAIFPESAFDKKKGV